MAPSRPAAGACLLALALCCASRTCMSRTLPCCCCGPPCSADGLAQQYLTSLAKLKAGKDCVLALAGALSLLSLAAEDANPCYIKSVAAAVLLDQLLQVRGECRGRAVAGTLTCPLACPWWLRQTP